MPVQLPSIGTIKHVEHLKEHLGYEFRSLEKEGVYIVMSQRVQGKINFIDLNLVTNDNTISDENLPPIVRGRVAQALSDIIVDELEEPIIRRILKRDYVHFPLEEQAEVFDFVLQELKQEPAINNRNIRKHKVLTRLLEYLESNNEIILEGFLRFRLKEYMTALESAVDHAVDDYVMEKEYGEFIRLLRYFVETQEPGIDEAHVIVAPNGKFWITDAKGKPLRNDAVDDLVVEMTEGDIEYEDIVMSTLITIAPRKVIIHKHENVECTGTYLETINKVFGDRVKTCTGCARCTPGTVNHCKL